MKNLIFCYMTASTRLSEYEGVFDLKMITTWTTSQHQFVLRSSIFFTKWFHEDMGLLHYVGLKNSQTTFEIWHCHAVERVLASG